MYLYWENNYHSNYIFRIWAILYSHDTYLILWNKEYYKIIRCLIDLYIECLFLMKKKYLV